jgi:hypothetical protein
VVGVLFLFAVVDLPRGALFSIGLLNQVRKVLWSLHLRRSLRDFSEAYLGLGLELELGAFGCT